MIMEKELEIPEGITLEADKKTIKVSGEKGQLERSFKYFHDIKIEKKEKKLIVRIRSYQMYIAKTN